MNGGMMINNEQITPNKQIICMEISLDDIQNNVG